MQVRLRLRLAGISSFEKSPEYRCLWLMVACDKRDRNSCLFLVEMATEKQRKLSAPK